MRNVFGLWAGTLMLVPVLGSAQTHIPQIRSLKPFHAVEVSGSLHVVLEHAQDYHLMMPKADSALDSRIVSDVDHGVLHLRLRSSREHIPIQDIEVHLRTPDLDALDLSGSGLIETAGIWSGSSLNVHLHGSGMIRCSGNFKHLQAVLEGSGAIYLNAAAQDIMAVVQGSGLIQLQGSCNQANLTVQGSGLLNVASLQAKQVIRTIHGSGRIQTE